MHTPQALSLDQNNVTLCPTDSIFLKKKCSFLLENIETFVVFSCFSVGVKLGSVGGFLHRKVSRGRKSTRFRRHVVGEQKKGAIITFTQV